MPVTSQWTVRDLSCDDYYGKIDIKSCLHTESSSVRFAVQPFKSQYLLCVLPGLTFRNSTFCPRSVFICFAWIAEQTAIISLYSIKWLVFITETECVYCAARAESLSIIQVEVLKFLISFRPLCVVDHILSRRLSAENKIKIFCYMFPG